MNKKYFIFFIGVVIFLAVIITSVVILANTNNKDTIKEKVDEEINFMESKLMGMINSLNNIPFSNSVLLEQNDIKGQSSNEESSGGSSGESSESGRK